MKYVKKYLAIILVFCMMLTNVDLTAFATGYDSGTLITITPDVPHDILTQTESVDELCEEVVSLEIDKVPLTTYGSKRLLVLSETEYFDYCNASSVIAYDNFYVLSYDSVSDTRNAFKSLSADTSIVSVEVDAVLETETSNFTEVDNNVMRNEALYDLLNNRTITKEIKVAILDTGIDKNKFNNVIDTGLNLSTSGTENSIIDDNGHGTAIAELIMQNAVDNTKLIPIKVANSSGKATVLSTYLGIQHAIESDVDIINLSMVTTKSNTSEVLTDAINEAFSKGIYTVVAAGNSNKDTENVSPANVDSAIVVSAVDNNKEFTSYSNYGSTVDLSALGTHEGEEGTSFAAARVSGILANALSKDIDLETISIYAEDLGEKGKDPYYGEGFISLDMANEKGDFIEDGEESDTSSEEGNDTIVNKEVTTPDSPDEWKDFINSQNPYASLFESQVLPEDLVIFTTDEDFDVTKDFYNIAYNSENFKLEYVNSVPSFKLKEGYYKVTYKATELTSGYYFNLHRYVTVKSPQENTDYDFSKVKEDVLTIASGVVDVTNATTGGVMGHTCVGTHVFNDTQHWQVCNICGDELQGTRGDHNYVGEMPSVLPDNTRGACAPSNNYTKICSCGSSISVPRKAHTNVTINMQSGTQFYHYAACECLAWVAYYGNGTSTIQMCTRNGATIDCNTPEGTARTCDICRNKHENKGHSIQLDQLGGNLDSSYTGSGKLKCSWCEKEVLHAQCSGAVYSSNYSKVELSYLITPISGTLSVLGNGWVNGHDENIHSLRTTISASGSGYLLKIAGTLNDSPYGSLKTYQWAQNFDNTVNGTSTRCLLYTHNHNLYKDHTAPTISSCTAVSTDITGMWGHGVTVNVSGTENTTERVKVYLYNASGNLVQEKEVAVSNNSYTAEFKPAYESKDGEIWQVKVKDLYNNEIVKNLVMPTYVDATLPGISSCSIDNVWAKTKTVTVSAYDYGAGDLQFNLNGLTGFEDYDTVSGNTYKKTFTLTGDVYSAKTLAVYVKDGADNIRTRYVDVSNIDKTSPTISKAEATVSGASATIKINASDTGSGVTNYAITTNNSTPTAGWSTSPTFNVSNSGTYYAWAKDYAGNISASKACAVNLVHTITVNLDGASYYKPDGTYVANGTTWSKQFTYGTPIYVLGTSTAAGESSTNIISKPTKTGKMFDSYTISKGALTESNGRMLFDASYDGDVTININWKDANATATCIDVLDSTGGTVLGTTTINTIVGNTIKGSDWGSSTAANAYYTGYQYSSCTTGTATTNGVTVYRIFNRATFNVTIDPAGGSMYLPNGVLTTGTYVKTFYYGITDYFATNNVNSGNEICKMVSKPTRSGHNFKGWKLTSGGGKIDNCLASASWDYHPTSAGNATITAQWELANATVTCKDVIGSTSGTVLGTTTWEALINSTASGSAAGSSTTVGAYYTDYKYSSCTSATVTAGGVTVYRIFTKEALAPTVSSYTGTYDGAAHSINVSCSGATITYSTTATGTFSSTKPTYTNAGTYTIYYKAAKNGYSTVSGSSTVTINKANNTLGLNTTSGTITYPNNGSFNITTNKSGGALTVTSSNTSAITASISGTTVTLKPAAITADTSATITVTSAATTNYNAASVTYTASIKRGVMTATATPYTGTYDGAAHSINVSCSGATITYSTTATGTFSSTKPTYTNAGTYTIYYKAEKAGYIPVSGSSTVTINKATRIITINSSYKTSYTYNGSSQGMPGVSDVGISDASELRSYHIRFMQGNHESDGSALTPNVSPIDADTYTLVVYTDETTNYKRAEIRKAFVINRANNTLKLSATNGTITYPVKGSFSVTTNVSGGALSINNNNTAGVTATLSGNTITLKPSAITADTSATITVSSAQTKNYYAASVNYVVTIKQGIFTVEKTDYVGIYDGKSHTITIKNTYTGLDSSGNPTTVTTTNEANGITSYWSSENSTKVKSLPTFVDSSVYPYTSSGKYIVYYEISKAGYKTATGQASVTIERAQGKVSLNKSSGSLKYSDTTAFEVTENISGGTLYVTHMDNNICNPSSDDDDGEPLVNSERCYKDVVTTSLDNKIVTVGANHTGSSVIRVTSGQTRNYKEAYSEYNVMVNKATNQVEKEAVKPLDSFGVGSSIGLEQLMFNNSVSKDQEIVVEEPVMYSLRSASVLSTADVELTYPNQTSLALTQNISGGAISAESSDEDIVTTWVTGNVVNVKAGTKAGMATITVTVAATENYNSLTTSFTVRVNKGTMYVDTEPFNGAYDGKGHGINLTTLEGATVTYSTELDGEYSETEPLYSKVGSYITYYRVECPGYYTVTGYDTVNIAIATGRLTLSSTSGLLSYPNKALIDISTKSNGEIIVVSDEPMIAKASLTEDGKLLVQSGTVPGTTTIMVYTTGTSEYKPDTAVYEVTVIKGTFDLEVQGYNGIYDGKEHSMQINCAQEGVTIEYRNGVEGSFSSEKPKYVNAGEYTTYYRISKAGYNTVQGSTKVVIEKADFIRNSYDYECMYDGKAHTIDISKDYKGMTIEYGDDESCTLDTAPKYKDVGTYKIYYKVSNDNYTTYTDFAIVTINKATVTEDNNFVIKDTAGAEMLPVTPISTPRPLPVTTLDTPLYPDVTASVPQYSFSYDSEHKSIATQLGEILEGIGEIVYKFFDTIKGQWLEGPPKDAGIYQEWVYAEGSKNNEATDMHYVTTFEITASVPTMSIEKGDKLYVDYKSDDLDLMDLVKSDADLKFSTEDGDIVKITEDGKLVFVGTGEAIVKVETIPSENYKETEPVYIIIYVEKTPISEENVNNLFSMVTPDSPVYNGEQKPVVITPENGEDMGKITIHYKLPDGTLTTTPPTNVGHYEVFITTTGGANFEPITEPVKIGETAIEKAESSDVTYVLPEDLVYNGDDLDVKVTTSKGEDVGNIEYVYKNTETGETVDKVINAGKYDVYVKPSGSENFNASDEMIKVGTVVVNKAEVKQEDSSILDKIIIPEMTEPNNDVVVEIPSDLKEGTMIFYKVKGNLDYLEAKPKTPGVYEVWLRITGNANFASNSNDVKVGEFTIGKYNTSLSTIQDVYDKTYGDPDFTLEAFSANSDSSIYFAVIEGSHVVKLSENKVSLVGTGTARIKVYTKETELYKSAEHEIVINVAKCESVSNMTSKPDTEVKFTEFTGGMSAEDLDLSKYPGWSIAPESEGVKLLPGTTTEIILVYKGEGAENFKETTMTVTVSMPACEHEWGEFVVLIRPTYEETGLKAKTCVKCEKQINLEIPMLSKLPTEVPTVTPEVPTKAPTKIPTPTRKPISNFVYPTVIMMPTSTPTVTPTAEPTPTTGATTVPAVTTSPSVTIKPSPTAAVINEPAKGTKISYNGAVYKITAVASKGATVELISVNNKNAKSFSVPNTVTYLKGAYKVTSIGTKAFRGFKKLTSVKIGANVKSIKSKAFYKCTSLTKVTMGTKVTSIGSQAFSNCTKLKTIKLSSSLTTIGAKAFYKCTSLTKITIPSKVKKIGKQSFSGCKKLKSITIKSTKLSTKNVGAKAFSGISKQAVVKVPKKKLESYKKLLKKKGITSSGQKIKK